MDKKPILIVAGEPNSIFSEILIKAFKKFGKNKPILLFASYNLLKKQLKKLKVHSKFNLIDKNSLKLNLKKNEINIINIDYKFSKPFEKITKKSNSYIDNCFKVALDFAKKYKISGFINGPVSKKFFLNNRYLGVTEYLSKKLSVKDKYSMLIYNKKISVCTVTTHLPIKMVANQLNKNSIIIKTILVDNFFKKVLRKKPKIAITGLNPHCENFFNKSEEDQIIKPAIKSLIKKNVDVSGPYPADTIFLKQKLEKFDVIIGMYHDQVLTPIKALAGFNAINVTLGLPFIRISPDHGPNFEMIGQNKSNPQSLVEAFNFLEKI